MSIDNNRNDFKYKYGAEKQDVGSAAKDGAGRRTDATASTPASAPVSTGASPATQVDTGWRGKTASSTPASTPASTGASPATQVDTGWRGKTASSTPASAPESTSASPATQVDTGWRGKTASSIPASAPASTGASPATQVDTGWRGKTASSTPASAPASTGASPATQVDTGWRNASADILDPSNYSGTVVANYFPTIDSFKDAVAKLPKLTASNGSVFHIKRTLSRAGGESIILLCADPNGTDVVAKVYYEAVNGENSSVLDRSFVLDYMKTEEGKKYTLAVSDIGLIEFGTSKYYFEIMPYCPNNDLSDDGELSFERIVEIAEQLNEALHSIHVAGFYHRDIKPENLYEVDGRIKLGDFGIAKSTRSNVTKVIAGTEGYAAPETTRYYFTDKSDYYSMGVTLAGLFEGKFIFDKMSDEMKTLAQESERLPLTRIDPHREELENLLNGLCRIDYKKRFGYEDVRRWLADHNYTGGVIEEDWPRPFRMAGEVYRDEQSMFEGITKDNGHWEEAKMMLYNKHIDPFFSSFRPDLASAAQLADEKYRTANRDKGLAVFLKSLYPAGPIVWKGYTFNSLSELGAKMVVAKNPAAYSEILQNNCISHWLSFTEGIEVDSETIALVDAIEALSIKEPELACYWFGNSFAPEKSLTICGRKVKTIAELMNALFMSPNAFYQLDGYSKLLNRIDGADLYGFLFSFGFREAIDKEWDNIKKCDLFHQTVILFGLLDNVAVKSKVDASIIRDFFLTYGPVGPALYTQNLVNGANKVYTALDNDGRQILAKISGFRASTSGNVDELFRAYTPLIDSVDAMYRNLVENPHCILTGVYDSKGVICTNLIGCFAFRIFDKDAPLGFNALLESANGGAK